MNVIPYSGLYQTTYFQSFFQSSLNTHVPNFLFPSYRRHHTFGRPYIFNIIPIIPLDIPLMMKACPLEDSYLLLDDIFYQPISYAKVSLPCVYFYPHLIEHTITYTTDCYMIMQLLILFEETLQSLSLSPAVLLCLNMLQFL